MSRSCITQNAIDNLMVALLRACCWDTRFGKRHFQWNRQMGSESRFGLVCSHVFLLKNCWYTCSMRVMGNERDLRVHYIYIWITLFLFVFELIHRNYVALDSIHCNMCAHSKQLLLTFSLSTEYSLLLPLQLIQQRKSHLHQLCQLSKLHHTNDQLFISNHSICIRYMIENRASRNKGKNNGYTYKMYTFRQTDRYRGKKAARER